MTKTEQRPVPHIRTVWSNTLAEEPEWWPVIGPSHDDLNIIGFPHSHYHVDYQFLTPDQKKRTDARESMLEGVHAVYACPVISVMPEMDIRHVPGYMLLDAPGHEGTQVFPVSALPHPEIPTETYLRNIVKKPIWPYPPYPHDKVRWKATIEEIHRHSRLESNMLCPHQRADLSGINPDEDGNITCPLHGLCWNAETGRMVPKA